MQFGFFCCGRPNSTGCTPGLHEVNPDRAVTECAQWTVWDLCRIGASQQCGWGDRRLRRCNVFNHHRKVSARAAVDSVSEQQLVGAGLVHRGRGGISAQENVSVGGRPGIADADATAGTVCIQQDALNVACKDKLNPPQAFIIFIAI